VNQERDPDDAFFVVDPAAQDEPGLQSTTPSNRSSRSQIKTVYAKPEGVFTLT
jgi:hypothetical protein